MLGSFLCVEGIFQSQDIFIGGYSLWHDLHKEEYFFPSSGWGEQKLII